MSDEIQVYALDGCYTSENSDSFKKILQILQRNRRDLYHYPAVIIIKLLGRLGREILRDPDLARIPGLPYLSLWLREDNLRHIYRTNLGRYPDSDEWISVDSHHEMIAQPRGIICHWIAGNIPFLGVFSFVLALFGKNASILKITPENAKIVSLVLKRLESCTEQSSGVTYSGQILSRSGAVISFPGSNLRISEEFSQSADCRIIYGGEEAIRTISRLPSQIHCETILYGPKISCAILDQESMRSSAMQDMMQGLAQDIVLYNQAACSSPHFLFCEKGEMGIRQVAEMLRDALDHLPGNLLYPLDEGVAVSVINTRGRFLLDETKDILLSHDLAWTICISNECSLEEPVQGRCIFLIPVDNLQESLILISRKIQTVALGMVNAEKRKEFSRELSYRGVDRILTLGTMHEYTQPWDGILSAERMVRWIIVRKEK